MARLATIIGGTLANVFGSSGDAVAQYESKLKAYFSSTDALAFWKGRVALYAMLRGLDLGPGDEVLVPGYTCVVVPSAILYTGARPLYVEIDPHSWNVTADTIAAALTPRTKVVIVQHSYGIPAEMGPILDLLRSRKLTLLEDCCHGFGSSYHGKLCGTFGAGSFFSGQWSKPFSTGLGGLAVINDAALAGRVRQVASRELQPPSFKERFVIAAELLAFHLLVFPRTIGLATQAFRFLGSHGAVIGSSSTQELVGQKPEGYFKGLSSCQASVGSYEIGRLAENVAHRRRLQTLYDQLFTEAGWPAPPVPAESEAIMVRYPVAVANKDELLALAMKKLVELGDWFTSPLHGAEVPLETFQYQAGCCPLAEEASRTVVNLPLHLRTSESAARRAAQFVLRYGRPCGPQKT